MTPLPSRFWRAAAFASLVLAFAGPTHASEPDDAPLNKVVELNKKALALYDALDVENASALLKQALDLCKSANLEKHPTAARTHVHLGVVYLSGLKNRDMGLSEFRKAIDIDPKIKITKSLSNPEVQAAFAEAQTVTETPPTKAAPLPFPIRPETPTSPAPPAAQCHDGTGFSHPLVTKSSRDTPIEIKARVPPALGSTKVLLAYRAFDEDDFLAREMRPIETATGWFHETIPVAATHGAQVAYYIDVQNADEVTIVNSGTYEAPHIITLVSEEATNDVAPASNQGRVETKNRQESKGRPGWWLVLALGSGGGYHVGSPEMNPKDTGAPPNEIEVSGVGAAKLLHIAPEIGHFISDSLILSAQGRFQFVSGAQAVHLEEKTYQPTDFAFAGFAKLTWLLRNANEKFLPSLSAQAGVGQIRHAITTPKSANLTGCGSGPTCKDTVLGGLGLAGVGAGLTYMLNPTFGLQASCIALIGFPHFMINGDVNVGLVIVR
jgi:hypothetical protein